MKGERQLLAIAHGSDMAVCLGKHFDAWADRFDVRRADEILAHRADVADFGLRDETAELVAVGIAAHGDGQCAQPHGAVAFKTLSEQDKSDILFGIAHGVDFIAASFVSTKQDVLDIQKLLDENGGSDIEIIAKIENRSGVDNVTEICSACGGIMIARGDLGVEIPYVEVPAVQKKLTRKCRLLGKRVITATEMLESMIQNPRPTRAEISDVANAVYDGTSCVMLSGESAAGKYPVEAVKAMASIAEYTEKHTDYKQRFRSTEFVGKNNLDCISHAVCSMAIDVNAKAIVVCSVSGKTAMLVSRFRTPIDIIGMTTNRKIWRRLSMSWGVTPVMADQFPSMEVMFYYAKKAAVDALNLQTGDNILLTGGPVNGQQGNTNTIKIETVE